MSNSVDWDEVKQKAIYYADLTKVKAAEVAAVVAPFVDKVVDIVQGFLNYEGSSSHPQFQGTNSMGKIGTTGFLIGAVGGIHLGIVILAFLLYWSIPEDNGGETSELETILNSHAAIIHWSIYAALLCLFHFLEFFTTAVNQPMNLSYDSFIVNHSKNYTLAALASCCEFWLESLFFGHNKRQPFFLVIGLFLILFGQIIRTVAMWQCGPNFSHQIMERNQDGHKLVTTGIYSILRHPAYFGWFYWSVGTQIYLCNPFCCVFYAYASWSFFSTRIPYEEALLARFYPQHYTEYANRTVILIPFIKSVFSVSNIGGGGGGSGNMSMMSSKDDDRDVSTPLKSVVSDRMNGGNLSSRSNSGGVSTSL